MHFDALHVVEKKKRLLLSEQLCQITLLSTRAQGHSTNQGNQRAPAISTGVVPGPETQGIASGGFH